MGWDAESVAVSFLEAYAAVYGTKQPRNRCEQVGRCVLDEDCPLYPDCELTDYAP